jgi:low temperature requirement protein LtrA
METLINIPIYLLLSVHMIYVFNTEVTNPFNEKEKPVVYMGFDRFTPLIMTISLFLLTLEINSSIIVVLSMNRND